MVVLSQNVESFQVLSYLVQWPGITPDGCRDDCWSPVGQQHVGGVWQPWAPWSKDGPILNNTDLK